MSSPAAKRVSNTSAKQKAVELLSRRDHSVGEIRTKLAQREYDDAEIESAVDDLINRGYLSDARFSESYIHMRQNKGYGPIRIAQELKQKGISEQDFGVLLQNTEESWLATIERVYEQKYRGQPINDFGDKAKRIRYLQYRGFSFDQINEII